MWKSKKFSIQVSAVVTEERAVELLQEHFDFNADEFAEPNVMTSSAVLEAVGLEVNRGNASAMGKVLRKMVGDQRRLYLNGVLGRYYALPPRKEPWL